MLMTQPGDVFPTPWGDNKISFWLSPHNNKLTRNVYCNIGNFDVI